MEKQLRLHHLEVSLELMNRAGTMAVKLGANTALSDS
jgi:hypothetical protein